MQKKELLFGLIIGVVAVYFISNYIIEERTDAYVSEATKSLVAYEEVATELSKLLARGAATTEVETLVPDCVVDDMVAYDSLLSALDKGLSYGDLTRLKELFAKCGDVAAKRRALMTMVLSEKVDNMTILVKLIESAGGKSDNEKLVKWQELAKKEAAISQLFISLVSAQESIIVALLKNVPATSITVENIRATAQSLREEMVSLTEEVSKLREEVAST